MYVCMYVCNFIDNLLFLGDNGLHTGPQSCYMRRPLSPMVWDKAGEKFGIVQWRGRHSNQMLLVGIVTKKLHTTRSSPEFEIPHRGKERKIKIYSPKFGLTFT